MKYIRKNIPAAVCFALALVLLAFACAGALMKDSEDISAAVQTTPTPQPTRVPDGSLSDASQIRVVAATPIPTQSASSFDFHGSISGGKIVGSEASETAAPTQSANSFDFHGSISGGKVVESEAKESAVPAQPETFDTAMSPMENTQTSSDENGAFARFLSDNAGYFALAGFISLALGLVCMCVVPAIRNYREGCLTDENITSSQRVLKAYVLAPNKWMLYLVIVVIVAVLIAWSSSSIEWKGLASKGSEVAYGIVHGITHPDMSYILSLGSDKVPYLMLQTIAIALLGTLIGGILAIPVAFLAAENVVPKWVAFIVRSFVLAIRTIPSIIWALCWVRVTGPGALCGVLTQSICSIGMISKMYITAIEDLDTRILESLDAAGCTIFQKIRYGIIPQLTANFISTIIYRFDINLKDATTLGIVGAGGIGASLIQAINSRRWGIVGSFLCGLIVLMLVIEFISTKIRARLAHGER